MKVHALITLLQTVDPLAEVLIENLVQDEDALEDTWSHAEIIGLSVDKGKCVLSQQYVSVPDCLSSAEMYEAVELASDAEINTRYVVDKVVFTPQIYGERDPTPQRLLGFHGILFSQQFNADGERIGSGSSCASFARSEKACRIQLMAKIPTAVKQELEFCHPRTHLVKSLKTYGLCAYPVC